MLQQIRQIRHHFLEHARFLSDPDHAYVKFIEQSRMLIHRCRNRDAFANGLRDLQYGFAQRRIFLFMSQTVQRLRNGNARAQQRSHFASERGDFLSFDSRAEMHSGAARCLRWQGLRDNRTSIAVPFGRANLKFGGKEPAFTQEQKRGFPVFRVDHTLDRRAASFHGLVTKRCHSIPSPEETRTISSSVVIPSAAFCNASW